MATSTTILNNIKFSAKEEVVEGTLIADAAVDGRFAVDSCGMGGIFHNGQKLTVDQILEGFFP